MKKATKKIRIGILLLAFVAVSMVAASGCFAKEATVKFPEKAITVINQNEAGGPSDVEIRGLQKYWEKELGQPIVQEYITTAGGKLAALTCYKAKPDGYTLYYINMPSCNTGEIIYNAGYKTMEFEFLQNLVVEYRALAVLASNEEIKSIDDLIRIGKEKELTIAHSGLGASSHLQAILLQDKLGINLRDIPFAGAAPAKAAFLGGHVTLWTPDISTVLPLLKEGKVRILAVHAPERSSELPDIPTFKELGYSGLEVFTARGFVAPPGLNPEAKAILIDTLARASSNAEFIEWAKTAGKSLRIVSGEEYRKLAEEVHAMVESVAPIIKKAIEGK